jgi:hydroxyacylglutathione hydrolase
MAHTAEALVIDPGAGPSEILRTLDALAARPLAILNTHGHYDHVGAVKDLQLRYDIPFYLSIDDARVLRSANMYRFIFKSTEKVPIPEVTHDLREQTDELQIGPFVIQCIRTPGHTPGGYSFLVEGHLFTGDTLMRGRAGPVDLPGGDQAALDNAFRKLALLPTIVHPGHGSSTTIAEELASNQDMRIAIAGD